MDRCPQLQDRGQQGGGRSLAREPFRNFDHDLQMLQDMASKEVD